MNRMTFRRALGVTVLAGCLLPSSAYAKPSLSWTLPAHADAGRPITVTYQAKRRGVARLALQRQVGTASVWRTVKSLSGSSGTVQAPALAMGAHRLRVVAIARRRLVAKTVPKRVLVFADVPFSALFSRTEYTFTFPSFTFAWIDNVSGSSVRTLLQVLLAVNTCRSVHVDWAYDTLDPITATLSLVQETYDAVPSTGPEETRLALDGPLALGKSWSVTVGTTNPAYTIRAFVNGRANCWKSERIG